MRVLVTGHRGYVGSALLPLLRREGHQVVGFDAGYFDGCGFGGVEAESQALRRDVRDITRADLEGCEAVIHLAALSNDTLGDLRPEWTYEINHTASVRLARMAKEAGVQRFLFSSSCSIYGASGELATESGSVRPQTPYAISKVRTEDDLSRLAGGGFSPVFLRNATAYGLSPRLRVDLVLNNLVGWAWTTGRVRILSDGTPWRPLVHVEDIARAFAAMLTAPVSVIHNQAFNVGRNDENFQVRDLARIVQDVVPGCAVEFAGHPQSDARDYRVDFTKLRTRLPQLQLQWDARQGAVQLYEAYRRTPLTLPDFEGGKYIRVARLRHLLATGRVDDRLRWAEHPVAAVDRWRGQP